MCKTLCYRLYILILVYYPQLMTESVTGGYIIILRSTLDIFCNKFVQNSVIRISKEYRLYVGVVNANMLHTILLLIGAGKFMLLDVALEVILYICADHKTVLSLSIHRLCINVVLFFRVTLEPALFLELLEVLSSLGINTGICLLCYRIKVYLRLDDVIQGHFIPCSLCTSLLRVEHVIRTALDLLYEFLGRTNALKRFYLSHQRLTINLVQPSLMNPTIWLAAAIPALILASAVWAPIFLGVAK